MFYMCLLLKWAIDPTDKMKDAVIAKVANQAADFYGDAFKQCQYKDNLPKVCKVHTWVKNNLKRPCYAFKQHINNTPAAMSSLLWI